MEQTSSAFRVLTRDEEEEFRQWARDNYEPSTEPKSIWHPIVRDEWRRIQEERRAGFTEHYHIYSSPPGGEGPEGAGVVAADDLNDLLSNALDATHYELDTAAEYEAETGQVCGENGEFEEGWRAWNHVNTLQTHDANCRNLLEQWKGTKPRAPLYQGEDGTALLRSRILQFLDDLHLEPMTWDGRMRLVVTRCSELECLTLEED